MSNMSYCRFRNTSMDLDDCKDALERLLAGDTDEDGRLSREELRAAKRLVKTCQSVVQLLLDMEEDKLGDAIDEPCDYDFDDCLDQVNREASDD